MKRQLLLLLLTFITLAGCSTDTGQGTPRTPISITTESQPAPATVADPASIDIPAIGARSTLIPLGLKADGTMAVPDVKTPEQAGWYQFSPRPGAIGPAVVIGHVDGGGRKGVFYRLKDLDVGDPVHVTLTDGRTLTFKVYREQEAPKTAFPSREVYGNTDRPELRLITCGGPFVGGSLGYGNNLIAYAVLVS